MSTDPTVSAVLVAAGIEEPAWWWVDGTGRVVREASTWETEVWKSARMRVGPQTAFGLAMKLDEWEPLQDNEVGVWINPNKLYGIFSRWAQACAATLGTPAWSQFIGMMIARIEHIGRDHAIRRALELEVEPGTLAELVYCGSYWKLRCGESVHRWSAPHKYPHGPIIPALAGVTNPTEAEKVIYGEVCV